MTADTLQSAAQTATYWLLGAVLLAIIVWLCVFHLTRNRRKRKQLTHILRARLRDIPTLGKTWNGKLSARFNNDNQLSALVIWLPPSMLPSKVIDGVRAILAEPGQPYGPDEWAVSAGGTKIYANRKPPAKLEPVQPSSSGLARVMSEATKRYELCVGQTADGQWLTLPLDHVAAMVVGGKTGSGKTGSLRSMFAPFIANPAVQFAIVNGKANGDWRCFEPRAFAHLRIGSIYHELEHAKALLASLDAELNRRFAQLDDKDFWDTGPTVDLPLLIVIIDECQKLLDLTYNPDDQKLVKQIRASVRRLTATGRAAGFLTVVGTQKPTAESIPTEIRDNAELRLCYSVMNRDAAEATLGNGWKDDGLSPVKEPCKGVCVCYSDIGGHKRAHSPLIAKERIERYAKQYAHLRSGYGLESSPQNYVRGAINQS